MRTSLTPTLCQSPQSRPLGIHLCPYSVMGADSSRAQNLPSVVSNLSAVQSNHTSRGGLRRPSVSSSTPAPQHHRVLVQAALWAHVLDMKMQCTDHSPHPLLSLKQKISITRAQWTQKQTGYCITDTAAQISDPDWGGGTVGGGGQTACHLL